jgi:hypothetical protein
MQLFGDTNLHKHGLVLTSGTSQTSAAFAKSSIKQDQSFRCMVTFRITAPPGSGEADGMAVVFSSEKKLGLGGYGLGYSGLGGKGDFAVESEFHFGQCSLSQQLTDQSTRTGRRISRTTHQHLTSRCIHRRTRITDTRSSALQWMPSRG